jgi:hypothetical protein
MKRYIIFFFFYIQFYSNLFNTMVLVLGENFSIRDILRKYSYTLDDGLVT